MAIVAVVVLGSLIADAVDEIGASRSLAVIVSSGTATVAALLGMMMVWRSRRPGRLLLPCWRRNSQPATRQFRLAWQATA